MSLTLLASANRMRRTSVSPLLVKSLACCYCCCLLNHHHQQVSSNVGVVGGVSAFTTSYNNNYYPRTNKYYYSSTTTTSSTKLQLAKNKKMENFPTWTFDKPCGSMEWNPLSSVEIKLEKVNAEKSKDFLNADLVLLPTMAPPPPKDAADDDEKSDDDEDGDESKSTVVSLAYSAVTQQVDADLGGALTRLLEENAKAFKNGAKLGSMTPTLRLIQKEKTQRLIVVGLGKAEKEEKEEPKAGDKEKKDPFATAGHVLGKAIANKCEAEKKVETVQVVLPKAIAGNATLLKDFSTSLYQNLYVDHRYKSGSKRNQPMAKDLKTITILMEEGAAEAAEESVLSPEDAAQALEEGRLLASGVIMAKDIVNAPHNVLNSESLADTAKRIAAESNGRLKCKILDKNECEKRNMGAYLGVARGSETEPQFIHLTYTPPTSSSSSSNKPNKKVGIVGKGLLFDTGGYNIKTSMMEWMKFDCGGSAAVLGAARAISALQPLGVEAHFIVAACENMINDKAFVPSDILTASNGKTIEIMNTDAEGRLTLADALVFADKEVGCESIIELSTLTGAMMVALGREVAGVFTNNDELATELADISKVTGDKSWRMPMETAYSEQLESKFADLKNIGTRYGGSITAALFLNNFVSKKKPFAHIDIAGPVWNDKTGATGYGAKLVVEWVRRQGLVEE